MAEDRYRLWMTLLVVLLLFSCSHRPVQGTGNTSGFSGFLTPVLDFYQGPLDHLSPVRTGTCPMHPSCSDYARECIARFGPLVGWMMACDRLLRCGRDELHRSPKIYINGNPKTHDPVAANVP